MSKKENLKILVKLISKGLCHKIGSIVNKNAIYAQKYSKEADNFFNIAKEISSREHWNVSDKKDIKEELEKNLRKELENKPFLDESKYLHIESEISWILNDMDLN